MEGKLQHPKFSLGSVLTSASEKNEKQDNKICSPYKMILANSTEVLDLATVQATGQIPDKIHHIHAEV